MLEKKNIIKVFKGKIIFTAIKDLEQPMWRRRAGDHTNIKLDDKTNNCHFLYAISTASFQFSKRLIDQRNDVKNQVIKTHGKVMTIYCVISIIVISVDKEKCSRFVWYFYNNTGRSFSETGSRQLLSTEFPGKLIFLPCDIKSKGVYGYLRRLIIVEMKVDNKLAISLPVYLKSVRKWKYV